MDIGPLGERVWLVLLPAEPQLRSELALLRNKIADADDVSLILDLSRVEIISSPSLGIALNLQRLLAQRGRNLILCKTSLATKCIFRMAGLESIFEFADDKFAALTALGQSPESSGESFSGTEMGQ